MFTDAEIRMLAEAEHGMDSGEIPYVIAHGHRNVVTQDAMNHFNLVSGQTVTNEIMTAILKYNINHCQQQIARQETEKAIKNMKK